MTAVVGVRFKQAGKIYDFNVGDLDLETGQQVIVDTARGLEYGTVVRGPLEQLEPQRELRSVVRVADYEDEERHQYVRELARQAFDRALAWVEQRHIDIDLADAEYTFDTRRLTFYFTAENKLDWRSIAREMGAEFDVRVELRQIGVRDKAKILGGIGMCGRAMCCSTFLTEFAPVSIRMAKAQGLPLNPSRITGVCGRLLCCLRFEYEQKHKTAGVRGKA